VGPTGLQGPEGPPGTLPSNLTAVSSGLGTDGYSSGNYDVSTCMIGDIVLSANSYGGGHYIPADGSTLEISTYSGLFALLGTRFGGDGHNSFQIPDLRPFAPQGLQYSICVLGTYPSRS